MKKLLLLVILFASICSGQAQNEKGYYVKHLEFPQNATLQEKGEVSADSTAIGLATDGTDSIPAFRY